MMLCIKFSSEDTSLQRLPLWLWHQNVHNALTLIAREVATQAHITQWEHSTQAHRHTAHSCTQHTAAHSTQAVLKVRSTGRHWNPPSPPAPSQLPRVSGIWKAACRPIHITQEAAPLQPDFALLTFLTHCTALCFALLYFLYCVHVESFALYFFTTFYILSLYCIFHITYFSHISRGPTTEGWWMVAFQQYLTGQRRRQVLFCSLFRLTFVKSELSL